MKKRKNDKKRKFIKKITKFYPTLQIDSKVEKKIKT